MSSDDGDAFRSIEPELEAPSAPVAPQGPYVPVLSEVVGVLMPRAVPATAPAMLAADGNQDVLVQATAQAVLRALGPEFEQRLAQAISHALHEQLQGLHARVRQAMMREVRAAVMATLIPSQASPGTSSPQNS